MRKFAATLGLCLAATSLAADETCTPTPPASMPGLDLAVSLGEVMRDWRTCAARVECQDDMEQVYGMNRVEGYVIDPVARDIILVGSHRPGYPALKIEDLWVALNNAAGHYVSIDQAGRRFRSDPGVSIDPSPKVLAQLDQIMAAIDGDASDSRRQAAHDAWCETCEQPQSVRVLGIPFDTHFAEVMLNADYDMKSIVDGNVQLGLDGFDSLNDRSMKLAQTTILSGSGGAVEVGGLTRFWFHPGETTYRASTDAVLLDRADVTLLDEQEHVTRAGTIEASGKVNTLARAFTCAFTRRYSEIAALRPIYRELEGLFRWTALAKLMVERQAFAAAGMDAGGFAGLAVAATPVPRMVPGQPRILEWDHVAILGSHRQQIQLTLPSCGGVSIAYAVAGMTERADPARQTAHIYYTAIGTRPGLRARWWAM